MPVEDRSKSVESSVGQINQLNRNLTNIENMIYPVDLIMFEENMTYSVVRIMLDITKFIFAVFEVDL